MNISLFAPYGRTKPEGGSAFLFLTFLRSIGMEGVTILCDGAVPSCMRDQEHAWSRRLPTCMTCMGMQSHHTYWAGGPQLSLSEHISPDITQRSKRYVEQLSVDNLVEATWGDYELFPLVTGSFFARFGVTTPDLRNKAHVPYLRKLYVSAIRTVEGFEEIYRHAGFQLAITLSGEDVLTGGNLSVLQRIRRPYVQFRCDDDADSFLLRRSWDDAQERYPLLIDDVSRLRPNVHTWGEQVTTILEQMVYHAELNEMQLSLPMAQN